MVTASQKRATAIDLRWLVFSLLLAVPFLFFVTRYWFLSDDSFISFRYAQNLVSGNGLVWNPGERVEGYTNFLWVLIMSAGMAAQLRPEFLSNMLGVVSAVAILVLLVVHSSRLHGAIRVWVWLAPAALVVNRSFAAWSTGGLETQFFSLLVLSGYLLLVRQVEDHESRAHWTPFLALALATLTRPEGAIFAAWAGCCWFLAAVGRDRRRWADLVRAFGPYALVVGLHFLWRYLYYGAWLPNTFHAKVNGFWWEQSARYFALFLGDYKLHLFAPLLLLPILWRRSLTDRLFGGALVLYLLYIAAIGGDRFEFRFLVVVLPFIYWLIAEGIGLVSAALARRSTIGARVVSGALGASLLIVTLLGSVRPEASQLRLGVNSLERMKIFAERRMEQGKALRSHIDSGRLPEDFRVAVGGAGALPYYTGWYTLDYYGLSEPAVARQEVVERSVIGHEHRASLSLMRDKGIVAFDPINRMYLRGGPGRVSGEMERLRERAAEESGDDPVGLRSECFVLGPGEVLLFASPQTRSEVETALPGLPRCDL